MRTSALVRVVLVGLAAGCASAPAGQLEANKNLVRQFTCAVNDANWDALDSLVADDFRRHSDATAGPPVTSREGFVELQRAFLVGVPDQRVTIRKLVAEEDHVAVLASYAETQTGPMGSFPATGKSFEGSFLAVFRVESGQLAELWVEWDNVAMLTQLGLFPPPVSGG